MAVRTRKRLGDILIEANVITQEQLMQALAKQKEIGKRLGDKVTAQYRTSASVFEQWIVVHVKQCDGDWSIDQYSDSADAWKQQQFCGKSGIGK